MIKAFFISSGIDRQSKDKSIRHCYLIADRYGYDVIEKEIGDFYLSLIVSDAGEVADVEGVFKFSLGCFAGDKLRCDRYLTIAVSKSSVIVENDFAGSIPVFYSSRNGLVLSNIEPCVYMASGSSVDDISFENLYGFLKYSHFIWDETAWKHIYQMLPDSKCVFDSQRGLVSTVYLETVRATDARHGLSDEELSFQLFELNEKLVRRSLSGADSIVLPLSSGYDSRMIFAVLANDKELANKTKCFTYGSVGSIEVEAARKLCGDKGVYWKHIDLPCGFLEEKYLREVSDICGASLHMHGMYQIEFLEQIKEFVDFNVNTRLTSGFMTGVPAGQHNGLLEPRLSLSDKLTDCMNAFGQSNVWSDDELEQIPIFTGKGFLAKAEERFRAAYERFSGDSYQKLVMFDVWTRQRNFISYYPRTLEWFCDVYSPHMNSEYAGFFMSLDRDKLYNRRAVEMMMLHYYKDLAQVPSNSNGLASLGSGFNNYMLLLSRLLNRIGCGKVLPKIYQNRSFEFDIKALKKCREQSFYPLLSGLKGVDVFSGMLGSGKFFDDLYGMALAGDANAYAKTITLQSVAINLVAYGDGG